MAVLNSREAAALVEASTGRQCSRQNLEKLCRRGRLGRCVVSLNPIRIDGELVVADYLANVDPMQVGSPQVAQRAPAPPPPRRPADDAQVPDYNESRARHEFEKANLAELERKRREGELIEREAVGRSLARLMGILRGGLLGLPSTLRDRIPHLTPEDVDTAEQLIRQQLEELAAGIEADGLPVAGDG
jgi:hypothetical protein